MKPGDLVQIIDHGGYYSTDPPRIGLIVGRAISGSRFPVLVEGKISFPEIYELRPLVNPDDGGYDSTKKNK